VHIQIFPINYAYFFTALGVQVHPLHPLAMPMVITSQVLHKDIGVARIFAAHAHSIVTSNTDDLFLVIVLINHPAPSRPINT